MIEYLLKNNIENKLYMLGFAVAVITYSFWQPFEEMLEFSENHKGITYFIGVAFAFCCYTSAYMFCKWDKWRWFPMFVVFICISRLLVEVLFLFQEKPDPTNRDIYDYISFLITIFVVFNYYIKYRFKQYKDEQQKENR